MISYAQNAEDVVLHRLFDPDKSGFYVDIGAADPVFDSVTKHFYDRGWRGINVEPSAKYSRLVELRPDDTNLRLCITDEVGTATYYEFPEPHHGLSTCDRDCADAAARLHNTTYQIVSIPCLTLAALFEKHAANKTIDFLKVDVEGYEHTVLRSNDWTMWRPKVLVVEATTPSEIAPSHREWEPLLLEAGYWFALFDGLNRFYVRRENEHLLKLLTGPATVLDDFRRSREVELERQAMRAGEDVAKLENMLAEQYKENAQLAAIVARLDAELKRPVIIRLAAKLKRMVVGEGNSNNKAG